MGLGRSSHNARAFLQIIGGLRVDESGFTCANDRRLWRCARCLKNTGFRFGYRGEAGRSGRLTMLTVNSVDHSLRPAAYDNDAGELKGIVVI